MLDDEVDKDEPKMFQLYKELGGKSGEISQSTGDVADIEAYLDSITKLYKVRYVFIPSTFPMLSLFTCPLFSIYQHSNRSSLPSLILSHSDDGTQLETIEGRLVVEMLDSNGCYVLDAQHEVYVWVGKNSSRELRNQASALGDQQFAAKERPSKQTTGRV